MIDDIVVNFLSAYFHEDWPVEAESDVEIVRIFFDSGIPTSQANQLADHLDLVAKSHENEKDETWLLNEFGCYYSPEADDLSASEWVTHLANLIRKEIP